MYIIAGCQNFAVSWYFKRLSFHYLSRKVWRSDIMISGNSYLACHAVQNDTTISDNNYKCNFINENWLIFHWILLFRVCLMRSHHWLCTEWLCTEQVPYHDLRQWWSSSAMHICSIRWKKDKHYRDIIISTMASQITSLMIVFSTIYSRR